MGMAKLRAPEGMGPLNPTKELGTWVELLGQQL